MRFLWHPNENIPVKIRVCQIIILESNYSKSMKGVQLLGKADFKWNVHLNRTIRSGRGEILLDALVIC